MKALTLTAMFLLACSMTFAAQALRSTQFESFTDPDFADFVPHNVVIVVDSGDFEVVHEVETRLAEELRAHKIVVFNGAELFPPTRPLESYDLAGVLAQHAIDGALIISTAGRNAQVNYFGSHSFSTVNATPYGGTVNTTTMPMIVARSQTQFTADLMAIGADTSRRTAWHAQIIVTEGGTAFVNAKSDAKGAVKAIIQGLEKDGHLRK